MSSNTVPFLLVVLIEVGGWTVDGARAGEVTCAIELEVGDAMCFNTCSIYFHAGNGGASDAESVDNGCVKYAESISKKVESVHSEVVDYMLGEAIRGLEYVRHATEVKPI